VYTGPIPEFVIMVAFAIGSQYLLGATRLGRYMYALGSNVEAARRVGISATRVTLVAYGLASVFATVGGMLLVARLTMGNPNAGSGAELQAIAAAVVGGASLFGGRGTIGGCLIGAVLFTTIGNGANLLGVNSFWQMVIEGLLIAGVVYLDNVQRRRSQGQQDRLANDPSRAAEGVRRVESPRQAAPVHPRRPRHFGGADRAW
jgi:ribose transport system permease protein